MYECSKRDILNPTKNIIVTLGGCGREFPSLREFDRHRKCCDGPGYSTRPAEKVTNKA